MPSLINAPGKQIPLLAAVLGLLAGCAGSGPTLDTSAEMTFDGLYPVKGGTADEAWARPGVDLSAYSKIMFHGVGVEYRPGGETGRLYSARRGGDYFEIPEKQKRRLENMLREEFRKELSKSEHFTVVDKPGPDVLMIRGGLLDVVSFVPPDPIGTADIYLSKVGEATLVLEIRDSTSEAVFARAIDRRAAEDMRGFMESNRVANMREVQRLVSFWAKKLRERLDTYGAPQE